MRKTNTRKTFFIGLLFFNGYRVLVKVIARFAGYLSKKKKNQYGSFDDLALYNNAYNARRVVR